MKFIAKLFPEITIKSRPVRKRLIQRLQSNLQNLFKRHQLEVKVRGLWDKVEVEFEGNDEQLREQVVSNMLRTPGIAYFMEVQEYPLTDFHDAYERAREVYEPLLKDKTFKVRVKRSGKHEFKSIDMERYIGGGLNQNCETGGVDVRKPDVFVDLEVKNDKIFIVTQRHPGLGGFPLGSQEQVLSLISGGFDSIVASFMSMRRGCKTNFVFFNLGGEAHEIGVKQVALYLWQQYGASARVKFVTVPFEEVVGEILQNVHHGHMGVILKRMMLRASERVANRMKIDALVTGESIAQVSSQTIPNLAVIDRATEKLVIRPLITMDKQDIVNVAKDIGAYHFAATMPEFCGVISDRPTTRAQLDRVEEEEVNFDFEVLDKALQRIEMIAIDDIVEDVDAHATIEAMTKVADNQVVVDIRAPHEQEKKPLNLPGVDVRAIPFYSLAAEFDQLDQQKEYLLYCEKGMMSQMQAHQLREKGHENVGVFSPADQGQK